MPSDRAAPMLQREVERRVRAELGWQVVGWAELGTGTNNRLYRLELADGPPLLAKCYVRDRWDRLGTEYAALDYLARQGVGGVPRPYLRDDEYLYGIYSFEEGERRAAAALGVEEAIAAARLAVNLHAVLPGDASDLAPANAACFAVADQVRLIEWRLGVFERDAYDEVRDVSPLRDLRGTVTRLVEAALAGLSDDEIARPLPRSGWRLNTYDFGPHNWLFREDGDVTVVDFEGAGWDDPARMVMGCVSHAGSDGLLPDVAAAFLGTYAEGRRLSASEISRYEQIGRLYDVEWVTVFASALTPAGAEPKRFGTPEFDLRAYLEDCIARLGERLERIERGDAYRFP